MVSFRELIRSEDSFTDDVFTNRLVEVALHIIEDFFFISLEFFITHGDTRWERYEDEKIILAIRSNIWI